MAKQTDVRASGRTPADEIAAQEMKTLDVVLPEGDPVEGGLTGGAVTRPEARAMSLTPGFTRMRTDWQGPDKETVRQVTRGADTMIEQLFGDAYDVIYEVYSIVREPVMDAHGTIVTNAMGLPEWKRAPGTNSYIEDWSRLGYRDRENLLFKITTGIFRWGLRRDNLWGEAMFARAQFEEAFANGYRQLDGDKPTIDDRTAHARSLAAEYRYHAVYMSLVSRKADTVVRSVELLGQRIKDLITER